MLDGIGKTGKKQIAIPGDGNAAGSRSNVTRKRFLSLGSSSSGDELGARSRKGRGSSIMNPEWEPPFRKGSVDNLMVRNGVSGSRSPDSCKSPMADLYRSSRCFVAEYASEEASGNLQGLVCIDRGEHRDGSSCIPADSHRQTTAAELQRREAVVWSRRNFAM
jgi:hypothetical protein